MERATNTHRDTIMRLALRVGAGCAKIMDEEMRDLTCRRIQADESGPTSEKSSAW
jgi:hypothetical protein